MASLKMSVVSFRGKDPGWIKTKRFHEVILKYARADITIALRLEPFYALADEHNWPREQRNPYYLAWNAFAMLYAGHSAKLRLPEGVIDLVFDKQTEWLQVMAGWEYLSKNILPRRVIDFSKACRNSKTMRNTCTFRRRTS